MTTAIIGTAFIDVKGFAHGKYDPHGRNLGTVQMVHGGVGRNVAENFANMGMPVDFVSMLEDSAFGHDIAGHLGEIGVGLEHALVVPERGIGIWEAILDAQGNLVGSISHMPDVTLLAEHVRACGDEAIRAADSVVLEIDLNERIAELVIGLAVRYGKPVYAIVGNMSVAPARPDLLAKTSCFICNATEAARLFGDEKLVGFSPEQMLDYLPAAANHIGIGSMVVTMGECGAVYCEGASAGICLPVEAKVVDTSGAGDAFFSGTVMSLIKGLPLSKAAAYGAKLAAATIGWNQAICPATARTQMEL